MVALGGGPEGQALIRRAARIAARSGGDLLAVHAARPGGPAAAVRAALTAQRRLTEAIGGTYQQLADDDIPAALLTFTRAHNATQLVLGTTRRPRLAALPARSTAAGSDTGAGVRDSQIDVQRTDAEGTPMTAIRCRWHDAGLVGVPPHTPAKQAAAAFALYALRLQSQGISPGPVEATLTITDRHGCYLGQLDLDAGDAQFMADAISGLLNHCYGPWTSQDIDHLRGGHDPQPPQDRGPGPPAR